MIYSKKLWQQPPLSFLEITMLVHPQIDPIAIHIGPITIYWYGIMYVLGFLSCCVLARIRLTQKHWQYVTPTIMDDLLFLGGVSIVVGGRIGFALLYEFEYYFTHPLHLLYLWEGGMSFHGGLVACMLGIWWCAHQHKKSFLSLADFCCSFIFITQVFGRIGNFINAEILGHPSDLPWAMIYPQIDNIPRHPIQIYQCLLDGMLIFIIMWHLGNRPRPVGHIAGIFLILYGTIRSFSELFKVPDFIVPIGLGIEISAGQLYSIPMLLGGISIMLYSQYSSPPPRKNNLLESK